MKKVFILIQEASNWNNREIIAVSTTRKPIIELMKSKGFVEYEDDKFVFNGQDSYDSNSIKLSIEVMSVAKAGCRYIPEKIYIEMGDKQ